MALMLDYPHAWINVEDRSIYEPVKEDKLPLEQQLIHLQARKGPDGIPIFCESGDVVLKVFGDETFDPSHPKYYTIESAQVQQVLSRGTGCWAVRHVGTGAAQAHLVLEAVVTSGIDVQQYEKDEDGYFTKDVNGDRIPLDNEGTPVTEPGLSIRHQVRALGAEEAIDELLPSTTGDATTYPLIVFSASYKGAYGNDVGFKLYYDYNDQNLDLVDELGCLFLNFAPVEKKYKNTNATPLYTIYNETSASFTIKPDQIYAAKNANISITEVLEERYSDPNKLPYSLYVYTDNIKAIGDAMLAVETDYDQVALDGWYMDLWTCTSLLGQAYDHCVLDTSTGAAIYKNNVIHYLQGGSDGTMTRDTHEECIRNFMDGTSFPDIVDMARYPFNSHFDMGYSLETKYKMLEHLSLREDAFVVVHTQDLSEPINNSAEDESVGLALRTHGLMFIESIIKGTPACRFSIVQQTSKLIDSVYNKYVPLSFEWADKFAQYFGGQQIRQTLGGEPSSFVKLLDTSKINWTMTREDHKVRNWKNGMNYVQFADRTQLFFPAFTSAYPYVTSALHNVSLVKFICFSKQAIHRSWAKFTGTDMYFGELKKAVEDDLIERVGYISNGIYRFGVTVYKTVEDNKVGNTVHVRLGITAPDMVTQWIVDIPVTRESYDSAA